MSHGIQLHLYGRCGFEVVERVALNLPLARFRCSGVLVQPIEQMLLPLGVLHVDSQLVALLLAEPHPELQPGVCGARNRHLGQYHRCMAALRGVAEAEQSAVVVGSLGIYSAVVHYPSRRGILL